MASMASRWSTSQLIAEHKDLQAVCLAISVDGRCALSSRRSISIINCNKPDVIDIRIKRETKWDSTAAEFNQLDTNLLAITNAQTVQIYNIDGNVKSSSVVNVNGNNGNSGHSGDSGNSGTNSVVKEQQLVTLRGHTRTITDLNWSYNEVHSLATASFDNNMYIWDIRDHRRPVLSMSSVAGATQVKWSKMNENVLATSHEGDVRVWDKRKHNTPIHYITAHLSKINGLDWNPNIGSQFATCSQDGTVRFWDLTTSKGKPDIILTTGLPVWRARFTPFGNGLITALVPQLRRTGENNSLWMWSMDCFDQPLHSFVGHLDVVLDFGWHIKNGNEYELITWSKDNSLRIWKVDTQLLTLHNDESIAHPYDFASDEINDNQSISNDSTEGTDSSAPQRPTSLDLSLTASKSPVLEQQKSVHSSHESDVKKPQTPETPINTLIPNLTQEFSLINVNIPNIQIEELNASKRICIITATTSITCRLKMTFPTGYPNHVAPQFSFLNGSTAPSEEVKNQLLKVLQTTAFLQVKRNRTCLEPCLRQFIASLERLTGTTSSSVAVTQPTLIDLLPNHHYGSYLDASVPFPRTSGARFCSGELLVCFGRPPHLEQMNAPTEYTPRSLSALSAYLSTHYRTPANQISNHIPSISSFYFDSSKRKKYKTKSKRNTFDGKSSSPKHKSNNCGAVFVFSVSGLLPISRTLAENYVMNTNGDIIGMCEANAKVARMLNRRDLCQTWNLVKLSAEIYLKGLNNANLMEMPWPLHPFGKKLIQSLIDHSVLKCNDIQTAAMLACTFHFSDTKAKLPLRASQPGSGNNSNNVIEMKCCNRFFHSKPGNSPYHTVCSSIPAPNTPETYGDWNLISAVESLKRTRSNSWSDFAENEALITGLSNNRCDSFGEQLELETHENNIKMLDSKLHHHYDSYKQIYADILYRWQLMEKRALILKCCSNVNQSQLFHSGIDFVTECTNPYCEKQYNTCRSPNCTYCKKPTLLCAICRMPVRGAVNHCVVCGHGGHTVHMMDWFSQSEQCPTGCGCFCLQQNCDIFG